MTAYHIIAAWKINFNIFNATTFAMRQQGTSILDDSLPPIPPSEKLCYAKSDKISKM